MSRTVDFEDLTEVVQWAQSKALEEIVGGKAPLGTIIKQICEMAYAHGSDVATERWSKAAETAGEKIIGLTHALEKADKLAEAGMMQMSAGGKHEFLHDIRRGVAMQGLNGGIVPLKHIAPPPTADEMAGILP